MRYLSHLAIRLLVSLGGVAGLLIIPIHGQATPAPQDGRSLFQANARIVMLDVVVSGKDHRPLTGLHPQDFTLSEDGHPQTIAHFEEHTAAQAPPASGEANLADAGPNMFTNLPRIKGAGQAEDSVTVLVLDSLNTPLADQSNLRIQVLKYLKKHPTGRRVAIFTLSTQLHLVQAFTDDPALLAAAVNHGKSGAGMQGSPLLKTNSEKAGDQEIVNALLEVHALDAALAMQQFLADQDSDRGGARVQRTLAALQALARYLAGFPGRKNVVWFTGAFPVVILPNPAVSDAFNVQRDNQAMLHKTDALLAAAQIAIYPVYAEGVATTALDAATDPRLVTGAELTRADQGAPERGADHTAMDQIAKDTGGVAFYGTNSLAEAMEKAIAHGSSFYTLTYTSTNPAADGQFRKIEVKLANAPGYQLAYRQGYYADDAGAASPPAARLNSDPLSPFLRPGLPDSTQIPVTLRVTRRPPGAQGVAANSQGGDNPNLKGPLTRYAVDFLIPAPSLQFQGSPDGKRNLNLEAGLVVYDSTGRALNWTLRRVELHLDAARYASAQTNGVNLPLQIDSPEAGATLCGGIYDLNGQLAGTLQLPLAAVLSAAMSIKPR